MLAFSLRVFFPNCGPRKWSSCREWQSYEGIEVPWLLRWLGFGRSWKSRGLEGKQLQKRKLEKFPLSPWPIPNLCMYDLAENI